MKIGRQVIISMVVRFLGLLLGFVSVKILTNNLSISNYGIYILIFSAVSILSICLNLGLHEYLVTKVPGEAKDKGFSYFTSTFIFESVIVLIFSVLVIGASTFLVKYFSFNLPLGIITLSALILFFGILFNQSLRFHSLRKRLEFTTTMALVMGRLWVLPLFFFWWFIRKITLNQILLLRLLLLILLLFVSLWLMKKKEEGIGNNKLFDKTIIREGLLFGVPLIIMGFGHTLLISADRYIIAFFLSTKAVGYYSLVYTLVNLGYIFSASLISIFYFHFIEAYNLGKRDETQFFRSQNIFNCGLKLSLIVSLFICMLFSFFRFSLIQIFSTKEYLIAANTMLFLAPFPVLLAFSSSLGQILLLEKQRKILVQGYTFAPLLNIFLNFILIPKWGIDGAAIATVISYFSISIFFFLKIRKYHVLRFPKFQWVRLGICLLLAVFPSYFLNHVSITGLFYSGAISITVYCLSLVGLEVVTKKDWKILFG